MPGVHDGAPETAMQLLPMLPPVEAQFEPLQPGNGYPYFQYLTMQSVGVDEGVPAGSNFVQDPSIVTAS